MAKLSALLMGYYAPNVRASDGSGRAQSLSIMHLLDHDAHTSPLWLGPEHPLVALLASRAFDYDRGVHAYVRCKADCGL